MKTLFLGLLSIGLFLNLGSSHRGEFYQVISSHPHDVEELRPYVDTVYKNGRLWVVQLKDDAPLEAKEHLRLLSGGEKSYMHQPLFSSVSKNKMTTKIQRLVNQIDKELIRKDVVELSSFESRYTGSQGNKDAVQLVANRMSEMGYEVEEICYRKDACSIVADKKGSHDPSKVIMVMGHIDSVGKTFAGADDNASGTAVALEMARVLKDYSNNKTIRFFITNGEELGLLGASHYARKLSDENKLNELSLVINMDMVGYNSNGVVELETEPEYESVAKAFANLAAQYTSLKTKITLGAWGSDHVPFLKRGVPSLLTIENWDTKTPCYHQACDKPDTLNYDYAAEIGKLNVSAVLTKDQISGF